MKNQKKNKLNICLMLLSFIVFMIVVTTAIVSVKTRSYNQLAAYNGRDKISVSDGWLNTSDHKVNITNMKYFHANGTTPYVYHMTLPATIPENVDFCFHTKNAGFAVFISEKNMPVLSDVNYVMTEEENNVITAGFKSALDRFVDQNASTYRLTKCISVACGISTGIGSRGMGNALHTARISDYAGEEIYVVLFPVYESSRISDLTLQNSKYYTQEAIQGTFMGFVMSLVIVILANAVLVMSMFMETSSKKVYATLALLLIDLGLWSMLSARTFDFILGTSEFIYTVNYYLLMISPVFIALFVDAFTYEKHFPMINIVFPVVFLDISGVTLSNYVGKYDLHDLTILTDFIIFATTIYALYCIVKDICFRAKHNFTAIHKITIMNLIIVMICGFIDAARYLSIIMIDKVGDNAFYTRIGILVFSTGMLLDVYNSFLNQRKKATQATTLRDIAFSDQLTGAGNRSAFARYEIEIDAFIKELSAKADDSQSIIYTSLDLNGLKQVNDVLGHAVGDNYIKTAARILKTSFQTANIYRIGGDEFSLFIVGQDANADYEGGLRRMLKAQEDYNATANSGIKMEFAYGSTEWRYFDTRDLRQMESDADKAMYAKKKEMKASVS